MYADDKRQLLAGHVKDGRGGQVPHVDTEDSLMLPMISSQQSVDPGKTPET